MKRFLIQITIILIPIFCFSQKNSEIDKLIDSLSWKSITCDHSWHFFIVNYKDASVQKLIKIGMPATKKLLESIEVPEKAVIIHIILTKILEPDNNNDWLPIKYIYKDCNKLKGWYHIFNRLVWEWSPDEDYTITSQEIQKVKEYWTNRINKKTKTWENNVDGIFESLSKSDSINYPCYKIYENNSEQIKADNLIKLFDYDFLFEFDDIFELLGNDSTISIYDDCFYISYGGDGIDFRFDIDNKLTTIFIKENYKGEIPYGLKYTDKKDDIEQKIGLPDKSKTYSKDEWVDYEKEKLRLHMVYNEHKSITKFLIQKKK